MQTHILASPVRRGVVRLLEWSAAARCGSRSAEGD